MVKDHSDSERGNPLPLHRLQFPISSKGVLYASTHRQDNTYHSICYTTSGALAGTRNIMLKEGNVRFNDTLNTLYIWLYGVGHG